MINFEIVFYQIIITFILMHLIYFMGYPFVLMYRERWRSMGVLGDDMFVIYIIIKNSWYNIIYK